MNKRILIVEDEFIIQMYLESIVIDMNCEIVDILDSSNNIERILNNEKIDLILMDLGIRGEKDGVETARFINQNHPTPIIFITGNSDTTTKQRIKEVNPLLVIFKPIDEEQLKQELHNALKSL